MPSVPDNHDAHDYAESVRERLQEFGEAALFSMYALACKAGVSPDMMGCIEQ
ncbi:MAG: hypothetical protein KDK99_08385 [Verrucomicrobiales bacterium]|nr:hypothetical protein [Verrucomicrobiales bacterium]